MQETILIVVKTHNQIEEMIPRIKDAVETGTRVIFLLRYHVTGLQLCCLSYVDALQPGAWAALAARYFFLGTQLQATENRISAACEALSRQGIEVTVRYYTGSLRKAIRKYTAREDFQLIIMADRGDTQFSRFLGRICPFSRFSKRRHLSPARLIRPDLSL